MARKVRLEDYIAVEEGMASWMFSLWEAEARPLLKRMEEAVEKEDYDQAARLLRAIDVQSIAQGARRGVENHVVTALTFGAMLAKGSDKVLYVDKPLPAIVDTATEFYLNSFIRLKERTIAHLMRLIAAREPTQKSDTEHEDCCPHLFTSMADLLLKSDRVTLAQKLNAVVLGQAKTAIDAGANLTTSRLVQLGFLQQSYVDGVTTYQITEAMDSRTCAVCQSMHGQTFSVQSGMSRLLSLLSIGDPDAIKVAAPFPSQKPDDVEQLRKMSQSEMEAAGLQCPPYHPGCRGMTAAVGTVQSVVTDVVPAEVFETAFAETVEDTMVQAATTAAMTRIGARVSTTIERNRNALEARYGKQALELWDEAGKLPKEVLAWLKEAKKGQ